MERPADFFSSSYAQARRKFLAAAEAAGLHATAHFIPCRVAMPKRSPWMSSSTETPGRSTS